MSDKLGARCAGPPHSPSRRGQWATIAVWVALAAALGQLQPKLADATENDTAAFLPSSAESTEVSTLLAARFRAGGVTPAFLVGTPEQVGDGPGTVVAAGGGLAYRTVPLRGETAEELQAAVDGLRAESDALVTGPAGLLVDAVEVFGSIDATLLVATSLLVLRPARRDLPQPVHRPGAAPRRRGRLRRDGRDRLSPRDAGGPQRQRPGHRDPDHPDVRRRHGLLPPPRRPLPRGTGTRRGCADRDADDGAPDRAGDPLERRQPWRSASSCSCSPTSRRRARSAGCRRSGSS